jgi:flagellar export protein FliJ
MRFKFPLERLLRLRTSAEQEKAAALQHARVAEEAQRDVRDAAAERLERCGAQLPAPGEVAPAGSLTNLRLTLDAAAGQLADAVAAHEAAHAAADVAQEGFANARRDRRVLERLRELRRALWSTESTREEQRQTDAVAQRHRSGGTTP